MIDTFLEWFLTQTLEGQGLGFNAGTIGAVGTVVFTCWQFITLVHQYRELRTGESVSVGWHTYFVADFAAFSIYGVYSASIAMAFNSLLGIGHLLVLIGLMVCKPFRLYEKLMLPLIIIFPVWMYFTGTDLVDLGFVEITERQLVFLIITTGTMIALALQPIEMFIKKSRGDVSFPLLLSYTVATGFWILYAFFATGDVVLQLLTIVAGISLGLSVVFWFHYAPKEEKIVTE